MGFFNFVNCVILAFAPHAIVYHGLGLSDTRGLTTVLAGLCTYLLTQAAKLFLLAALLVPSSASAGASVDVVLETMRFILAAVDVFALGVVVERLSSGPRESRTAAIGIGWSLAESLCSRLPAFWIGARTAVDWDWSHLCSAAEASLDLVIFICAARLACARMPSFPRVSPLVRRAMATVAIAAPTLVATISKSFLAGDPFTPMAFRASIAAVAFFASKRLFGFTKQE